MTNRTEVLVAIATTMAKMSNKVWVDTWLDAIPSATTGSESPTYAPKEEAGEGFGRDLSRGTFAHGRKSAGEDQTGRDAGHHGADHEDQKCGDPDPVTSSVSRRSVSVVRTARAWSPHRPKGHLGQCARREDREGDETGDRV